MILATKINGNYYLAQTGYSINKNIGGDFNDILEDENDPIFIHYGNVYAFENNNIIKDIVRYSDNFFTQKNMNKTYIRSEINALYQNVNSNIETNFVIFNNNKIFYIVKNEDVYEIKGDFVVNEDYDSYADLLDFVNDYKNKMTPEVAIYNAYSDYFNLTNNEYIFPLEIYDVKNNIKKIYKNYEDFVAKEKI